MLGEVERHHHRGADTFGFVRQRVDDPLRQPEAFGTDFGDGSLHGNVVGTVDLREEVGFDVDDDNAVLLPVDMRTHRSEVFRLAQIVEREIDGVVDVSELVNVVKA